MDKTKLWGIRVGETHFGHIFNYLSVKPNITLICGMYDETEDSDNVALKMCKIFKQLNPETKIILQNEHKNQIYEITHRLMHGITFGQLNNKVPSLCEESTISKISYPIMMTADILTVLSIYRESNPNANSLEVCVGKDNQINLEVSKTILRKAQAKHPTWFSKLNINIEDFIDASYTPVLNNLKNKNIKMSSSSFGTPDAEGVIYLSDTAEEIDEKIKKAVSYDLQNPELENGLYQIVNLMNIDTSSMSWFEIKNEIASKINSLLTSIKKLS